VRMLSAWLLFGRQIQKHVEMLSTNFGLESQRWRLLLRASKVERPMRTGSGARALRNQSSPPYIWARWEVFDPVSGSRKLVANLNLSSE